MIGPLPQTVPTASKRPCGLFILVIRCCSLKPMTSRLSRLPWSAPGWALGSAMLLLLALHVSAQNFVNFEAKQTSPVRLSPDGSRLFAVNTPDNRVSVFDVSRVQNPILIAEIPVGLEPVSVQPLNNDQAWVVN